MPRIEFSTAIDAPIERVFDLARSIDLHTVSTSSTAERAIAGVTSGLIGPGEEVTWQARHFGVWQKLTIRVTDFDRPRHFRDIMLRGAFKRMEHDHFFEQTSSGTIMRDVFEYQSPLSIFGAVADRLFLERYMRNFLAVRISILKKVAESNEWNQYV